MQSAFDLLPILRGDPLLLASDYDFTLCEVAPTPAEAILSAERRRVITALQRRHRLVIVTGRSEDGIKQATGLENDIWIVCGGLRIIAGRAEWVHPDHDAHRIVAAERKFQAAISEFPEAWVENVGGMSLTAHWRQTPPEYHGRVAEAVRSAVRGTGLRLIMDAERFGAMMEQSIVWTKGDALARLLYLIEWRGKVVAFGDSAADDSMFAAARQTGGIGIRVGGRASAGADAQLGTPSEVYQFLQQLSEQGV